MERQPEPIANDSIPIWDLVITDMQKRNETGKARYGTYLQAFNGRNSLQDAYEEALDLVVYLRQKLEEDKEMGSKFIANSYLSKLYCMYCEKETESYYDKYSDRCRCSVCYI